MKKFISAVVSAWGEFRRRSGAVRDAAKAHGEALILLRAECGKDNVNFTDVLKENNVPVSTAYDHIQLSEVWGQVEAMAQTMGVKFDTLSIGDILNASKNPDKIGEKPQKTKGKGKDATGNEVPVIAQKPKKPNGADKAREEAAKSFLKKTFDLDVAVFFQKGGQPITVELADGLILIVPVK